MTRVAVVTGGASGMGEATCHELGRRGHKVAVLDINDEAAQRVSEDLRAEGVEALGVAADVTDRPAVEEAFAKVRTELGPVSILVTSAGMVGFAVHRDHARGLVAHHRRQPHRHVPLLSGGAAGHDRGRMGPHRDDLVVERPTRLAEDGALRGLQGRGDHADQIAGQRIRARWASPSTTSRRRASRRRCSISRRPQGHLGSNEQMAAGFPWATSVPATTSPRRSDSCVRRRPASSPVRCSASTAGP